MEIEIKSILSIREVASRFLENIDEKRVIAFHGKMGAGKTTFIKAICEELGVKDIINSPTFSIVNEYWGKEDQVIYHFDCYRIEDVHEALDLGAEEYLFSGHYCFIEWPENITPLLPDDTLHVTISEADAGKRILSFL